MIYPLDSEVRSRIMADFRARRGPFRFSCIIPYALVSHYGTGSIKKQQANAFIKELGLRPAVALAKGGNPQSTYFILDEEALAGKSAREIRHYFHEERGLPFDDSGRWFG
jgi:hypothetical protein